MNKSELEAALVAVKIAKAEGHSTTQEALKDYREKKVYHDMSWRLNHELGKTFPGKRTPSADDIEIIEKCFDSSKYKGWIEEHLYEFALQYFSNLLSEPVDDKFSRQRSLSRTITEFSMNMPFLERGMILATLNQGKMHTESQRKGKNFDPITMYVRLRRDQLLHKEEYQKKLITAHLDSVMPLYMGLQEPPGIEDLVEDIDNGLEMGLLMVATVEKGSSLLKVKEDKKFDPVQARNNLIEFSNYMKQLLQEHSSFITRYVSDLRKSRGQDE